MEYVELTLYGGGIKRIHTALKYLENVCVYLQRLIITIDMMH